MTEPRATDPLRRSTTDRVVAGVAGGLARHLRVDPALIRIVLAVSVFFGGIGVVAYVLAWLILPPDDAPDDAGLRWSLDPEDVGRIAGIALVSLAALIIVDEWWWAGDVFFPLVLIAAGAWLLLRHDRGGRRLPSGDAPSPGAMPAPTPAVVGATATAPIPTRPEPPVAPPPPTPPRGYPTGRVTAGAVAVLGGVLGLAAANGADVELTTALIGCLALCGAGLVVGAFTGRSRGLIALALPLLFVLSVATVVDVPLEGGIGERRHAPQTVAEVEPRYRLGVGEMVIDLTGLDRAELRSAGPLRIDAAMGVGSLNVLLPPGVEVEGEAKAQLGDIDLLGQSAHGTDARRSVDRAGEEGAGVVVLDLRVGLGEVVVVP